jgi:hypothetical protein
VDSTLTLPPLDHRTSLLYPELAGDTSTCDAPWTLPQLLERNSRMSNYCEWTFMFYSWKKTS